MNLDEPVLYSQHPYEVNTLSQGLEFTTVKVSQGPRLTLSSVFIYLTAPCSHCYSTGFSPFPVSSFTYFHPKVDSENTPTGSQQPLRGKCVGCQDSLSRIHALYPCGHTVCACIQWHFPDVTPTEATQLNNVTSWSIHYWCREARRSVP